MLKLIYTFDHVFIVNSRCYVRKLVPLCTFLKFHTHLEVDSARLFQIVFSKCSRGLKLVFSKKWNFSWTLPYFEVHTTLSQTGCNYHPQFSRFPLKSLALWPTKCRLGNSSNKEIIINNKLVVIKDYTEQCVHWRTLYFKCAFYFQLVAFEWGHPKTQTM